MGRKPWRKLWQDKLRSSPKWTRLRMADKGFWFECFQMAQEDGRLMLRPGVPLTVEHLAYEFRSRHSTVKGWMNALEDAGLAATTDGTFALTGMTALLQRDLNTPSTRRKHDGIPQEGLSDSKGLRDNSCAPKEKEEKKREKRVAPIPPEGDLSDNGNEPKGFAEWYATYPNKAGRAKALLYWTGGLPLITKKKANHEPYAEKIIASLHTQIAGREAAEREDDFVPEWPNAATYLYNRRWEDPAMSGKTRKPPTRHTIGRVTSR